MLWKIVPHPMPSCLEAQIHNFFPFWSIFHFTNMFVWEILGDLAIPAMSLYWRGLSVNSLFCLNQWTELSFAAPNFSADWPGVMFESKSVFQNELVLRGALVKTKIQQDWRTFCPHFFFRFQADRWAEHISPPLCPNLTHGWVVDLSIFSVSIDRSFCNLLTKSAEKQQVFLESWPARLVELHDSTKWAKKVNCLTSSCSAFSRHIPMIYHRDKCMSRELRDISADYCRIHSWLPTWCLHLQLGSPRIDFERLWRNFRSRFTRNLLTPSNRFHRNPVSCDLAGQGLPNRPRFCAEKNMIAEPIKSRNLDFIKFFQKSIPQLIFAHFPHKTQRPKCQSRPKRGFLRPSLW